MKLAGSLTGRRCASEVLPKILPQRSVSTKILAGRWCSQHAVWQAGGVASRQCSRYIVWQAGGVVSRQCGRQATIASEVSKGKSRARAVKIGPGDGEECGGGEPGVGQVHGAQG